MWLVLEHEPNGAAQQVFAEDVILHAGRQVQRFGYTKTNNICFASGEGRFGCQQLNWDGGFQLYWEGGSISRRSAKQLNFTESIWYIVGRVMGV